MRTDFKTRDQNGKLKRFEFLGTVNLNGKICDKWREWEFIEADNAYVLCRVFSTKPKATKTQIVEEAIWQSDI